MTTTLIFASQVLLDIHHILGEQAKESCDEVMVLIHRTEASFRIGPPEDVKSEDPQKMFPKYSGEAHNKNHLDVFVRISLRRNADGMYGFDNEKDLLVQSYQALLGLDWKKNGIPREKRGEFLDEWSKTRLNDSEVMQISTENEVWETPTEIDIANIKAMIEADYPGTEYAEDVAESCRKVPQNAQNVKNGDIFNRLRYYNIPSNKPFFFNHNPSNCGSRLLMYSLDTEEYGVALVNYHWSIFLVSHLYNAARQMGILGKSWPEMDNMIELHLDTLFCGKVPATEDQIFRRFMLAYGIKPSEFKYNERTKDKKVARQSFHHLHEQGEKKGLLQCTKTSNILRKLMDKTAPITLQQCLYRINSLIEESSPPNSKGKTKKSEQHQLTYVELLGRLRNWLPKAVQDMQIDYVELSRACNAILWRIRLTVLVELHLEHAVAYKAADKCTKGAEVGFPNMVWDILLESGQHQKGRGSGKNISSATDPVSPQMQIVGKVLRKFLGEAERTEESSESGVSGER